MNKLLPIGSIIKIKSANNKYIIIGKCINSENQYFDYKCAPYPYGFTFENNKLNINKSDIEIIYQIGNINY